MLGKSLHNTVPTVNTRVSTTSTYVFVGSNNTVPITNGGTLATSWANASVTSHPSLHVSGDTNIEGNLKVRGKDIKESLEEIEKRLSILVPDPKKLAKYEALQRAYEHYKTLEALCYEKDN